MTPEYHAKNIHHQFWDWTLPVDPAAIATRIGVRVFAHDQIVHEDHTLSGLFVRSEDGSPEIHFSLSEPPVRQRFTVAHELGHYVMQHGNSFRDPSMNFSLTYFDPQEVEANHFAAELLMPEDAVRYFFESGGLTTLEALADKFNVSGVAMKYRLKNLGYLP